MGLQDGTGFGSQGRLVADRLLSSHRRRRRRSFPRWIIKLERIIASNLQGEPRRLKIGKPLGSRFVGRFGSSR